jgi:hypothetical protein
MISPETDSIVTNQNEIDKVRYSERNKDRRGEKKQIDRKR